MATTKAIVSIALLLQHTSLVAGFVVARPSPLLHGHARQIAAVPLPRTPCMLVDPTAGVGDPSSVIQHFAATTGIEGATTSLMAFADQGNNLAGLFFQASLLPYLLFLYFLGFEGNRTPKVASFGFQFLLLFVLSTVFTGIVTKSVYSSSLADVDWLHGAAEALLTTSNLYVAFGFRGAMEGDAAPSGPGFRYPAFAVFACVVLATAAGPSLGLEQHSAFLGGIGNLATNPLDGAMSIRPEPINALSIPTWIIHFSSVFEWIFAMGAVSQYAAATGNPRWRWLTYGMLPLHASGVAACTYHFFYNSPDVKFLVELQAGLTLLGNTTVFIAALLIALSNGWTLQQLNPFAEKADAADSVSAEPPQLKVQQGLPLPLLVAELVVLSVGASFALKYGETALSLPFEPNAIVGWALVAGIPALVGYSFVSAPDEAAASAQ